MIQLLPNRNYVIYYTPGRIYKGGEMLYFQTLDTVPDVKHLIQVRDIVTNQIVDLMELLSHPWSHIEEVPQAMSQKQESKKYVRELT